jgi:hypothetical protein
MARTRTQVVWLACAAMTLGLVTASTAQELTLDGASYDGDLIVVHEAPQPEPSGAGPDLAPVVDTVGDTSNTSTGTALAKGNAYRVDLSTGLVQAEFWLNFSNTQTLNFYVYQSPVEFGTYTQVFLSSTSVTGTGAAWYSSGPINYWMNAGNYYIIAVSWSGSMSYTYDTGDSQAVSFGEHVYGYATGTHPLPAAFTTSSNDQAIYHQRLTTDVDVPVTLRTLTVE